MSWAGLEYLMVPQWRTALARLAAEYLHREWGIASVRVAREAMWIRVSERDAEDAALGLAVFTRLLPRPVKLLFVS